MVEQAPQAAGHRSRTRVVVQGVLSLMLVVAIFYVLRQKIDPVQTWAAITAMTWLELAIAGGLGFVEGVLVTGLVGAGGDPDEVAAAVVVYRALTWALPILVGDRHVPVVATTGMDKAGPGRRAHGPGLATVGASPHRRIRG
jgi:uncharacterized membrane protein YbhN (UPF0104 family)